VDLAAVFLLPLLGGYCFASTWRGTAFRTGQIDGQHLYFRAALWGVALFSFALALRTVLVWNFASIENIEYVRPAVREQSGFAVSDQFRRIEWVIVSVYSLLLGAGCGPILNLVTPRMWALRRNVSALHRFLSRAYRDDVPVALTLDTGKVYIGLVNESLQDPAFVTLMPRFSGHRDSEGRIALTTDYDSVYSRLAGSNDADILLPADWPSNFELTIRADKIITATPFSPAIYTEFNPGWRERIAQQATRYDSDDAPQPPTYVLASISRGRRK
jgi:hypothetical protein